MSSVILTKYIHPKTVGLPHFWRLGVKYTRTLTSRRCYMALFALMRQNFTAAMEIVINSQWSQKTQQPVWASTQTLGHSLCSWRHLSTTHSYSVVDSVSGEYYVNNYIRLSLLTRAPKLNLMTPIWFRQVLSKITNKLTLRLTMSSNYSNIKLWDSKNVQAVWHIRSSLRHNVYKLSLWGFPILSIIFSKLVYRNKVQTKCWLYIKSYFQ